MRSGNCDGIIHLYYIIVALDHVSTGVYACTCTCTN